MKLISIHPGLVSVLLLLSLISPAVASTFYVSASGTSPAAPFASWSTAATNIQDAIDAAANGDTVLVTNGIYAFGGKVMAGDLMNRVALSNAITVQSINGPWVTSIQGVGATNGTVAVRCAWLTNGASLIGFTLARGATRSSGDAASLESGGGAWCASTNAVVSNCVIVSNTATSNGGGVYQGTVTGCLISSNGVTILSGGASYKSILNDCTIVSNSTAGAASPLAMTNCIIYYNGFGNYQVSGSAFSHCCTTPALTGTGNFTGAPQLFADGVHLSSSSPCIGAGVNPVTGTDVFGNSWSNPPAVGCAEWTPLPLVTTPQIKLSGNPIGFSMGNVTMGNASPYNFFWLKDGSALQDNGHFSSTLSSNLVVTGILLSDAGNYQLVVSNAFGVTTSTVAPVVVHCVNAAGTNPVVPYPNWATAATNIQDAITAAAASDIVLVTNGLYAYGGKSVEGLITNRVTLDKPILVQSVNGSAATIIQGAFNPTTTNGVGAIRCAWLTNFAILSGFTLQGGATRETTAQSKSSYGGGVLGTSTNAMVCNSTIINNFASYDGGGAFLATLNSCILTGNEAVGSGFVGSGGANAGSGGGAEGCNLNNCLVTGNTAYQSNGGGADNCNIKNSALIKNSSGLYGGGANLGTLVNCTVSANGNISTSYASYGGAVANAVLTDCIVSGNYNVGAGPTNYTSCTFSYSDSDPLPAGTGNIDVNPQLLSDGFHVLGSSPCLGAGNAAIVSGTDIDGQSWNNPPAIGCDEWQPVPVIGTQPAFRAGFPPHALTLSVVAAGQTPFTCLWSKDGALIQDDGHNSNSATTALIVNHFGPDDAGAYQVVITNSSGIVTSAVLQVVIHAVNAAGTNPVSPYTSWSMAATNIQDAVNAAAAGDIVLVTNGIYATGGMVMTGNLTNRVALNKPMTLISANGYKVTAIQGAWDPIATNGPGAVRCVWLADGALLYGFTLQNGATRATGDGYNGGPLESGGAVWCNSANGTVANCLVTNNSAIYGGGMAYGTLNNSLVIENLAAYGGGAYYGTVNNCTVVNNFSPTYPSNHGAGTYGGFTRNSIVVYNYDYQFPYGYIDLDNEAASSGSVQCSYTCTFVAGPVSGSGNTNANPQFLDLFHISSTSPCLGAGNSAYASGFDLDDEPWNNPPAMGCDEVVVSNLAGPLSISLAVVQTNLLVRNYDLLWASYAGHASQTIWSFGDGTTSTNGGPGFYRTWLNPGDYTVSFTAYNNDNPGGVTATTVIHVVPPSAPQIQSPMLSTNGFQFQFSGQLYANYTIQYSTNLAPPVTWQTLNTVANNTLPLIQITDPAWTNAARFYRVLAH